MCLRWSSLAERTAASSVSSFSFSFKCSLSGRKTRTRAAPGGQLAGPGPQARVKLPHPWKSKNYMKQQQVRLLQHRAETQRARSFYYQGSAPQCPALHEHQQHRLRIVHSAEPLAHSPAKFWLVPATPFSYDAQALPENRLCQGLFTAVSLDAAALL